MENKSRSVEMKLDELLRESSKERPEKKFYSSNAEPKSSAGIGLHFILVFVSPFEETVNALCFRFRYSAHHLRRSACSFEWCATTSKRQSNTIANEGSLMFAFYHKGWNYLSAMWRCERRGNKTLQNRPLCMACIVTISGGYNMLLDFIFTMNRFLPSNHFTSLLKDKVLM